MTTRSHARKLAILVQDPYLRLNEVTACARVDFLAKFLSDGPSGHRVKVIDLDASANTPYGSRRYSPDPTSQASGPHPPGPGLAPADRKL